MAVIDFHSHILPGVDDGSRDTDMSIKMLKMAESQGVDIMVATPHFYASRHRISTFLERRERALHRLMERISAEISAEGSHAKLPRILTGAEVAYFDGISRSDQLDALTVEDTKILLLEMPFLPWTDHILDEVETLVADRQYRVILAHLERYMKVADNRKRFSRLFSLPLYVQINAGSLTDWRRRRTLMKMFDRGEAHLLGSDCHNIESRQPNLQQGRDIIQKKLGVDRLHRIDQIGASLLGLRGE